MWSKVKKRLEKEFLCEKLQGRLAYHFVSYRTDTVKQNNRITICLDGNIIFCINTSDYCTHRFHWNENYLKSTIDEVLKQYPEVPSHEISEQITTAYMFHVSGEKGIFTIEYALNSMRQYFDMSIQDVLHSENYFIRMLAILDRRVGRRTLCKLAKDYAVNCIPEWLREFYRLRFDVEEISYATYR